MKLRTNGRRIDGRFVPELSRLARAKQEFRRHWRLLWQSRFALSGAGEPLEVRGSFISHGLFEILRVSPQLGRTFTANEDRPEEDGVVILGHNLWQRNFGGDPNIVGRKIMLSSRARTVVGVMPPGFRFPDVAELWAPVALTPKTFTRTDHGLLSIARLKDGVNVRGSAGRDAQHRRAYRATESRHQRRSRS